MEHATTPVSDEPASKLKVRPALTVSVTGALATGAVFEAIRDTFHHFSVGMFLGSLAKHLFGAAFIWPFAMVVCVGIMAMRKDWGR
jgi:hypothetical protein